MADVLVLYQTYPPDPAAGGRCVADVATLLAGRGHGVRVVTADRGYDDPSRRFARVERQGGVHVRRLPLSSLGKGRMWLRLVGETSFVLQAIARGIVGKRPAVIVAGNSPPLGLIAGLVVSRWHGVPLVYWLMDLHPDAAVAMGMVKARSAAARVFDWLNRLVLLHAHTIIVMDDEMERRLAAKGPRRAHIRVIPPWGGPPDVAPVETVGNRFREANALHDRFVVMYSGNHNRVHPLFTLLDAAAALRSDHRFAFVFIGNGHGKRDVEARALENVISLPYQPCEELAESLGAADVHVVVMGNEMVGIVHPSKLYGVLAVGRPILYIGPSNSHAARNVREHGLGWCVSHGDDSGVADAIRAAADMTVGERRAMGRRARAVLEESFAPPHLQQRVVEAVVVAAGTS